MLPEFESRLTEMDPIYREKIKPILEALSKEIETERKHSAELAVRIRRAIEERTLAMPRED